MSAPTRASPALAFPSSVPTAMDDAQLVAALLAGDERAWRTFHAVHSTFMLRAIYRVKRRFPQLIGADDVAEIHANICLQLLSSDKHRLRRFDPGHGTPFCAWLEVLARHAAYDFLRERRRQPQLQRSVDDLSEGETLIADTPDAFRVYCAKERALVVSRIIDDLSPRDREFVALYYCEGLDPEQTAERLGICVATVYSKKHKIRARIEDLLEKCAAA
jgi:RNA polymerase sigma-70 factor, ECF subfamily